MLAAALALIPYPSIDPVLISFGPLAIRWYGLAYVVGLLLGWRYVLALSRRPDAAMTPRQVDDFLVWATFGVILGGATLNMGADTVSKKIRASENDARLLYAY